MRQFSINLGGGSGGVPIAATPGDLPPTGSQDGEVYYVLSTRKLYSWNVNKTKWVVVGGEGAFLGRVNQASIPDATQTVAVSFTENMPSADYTLMATIRNTVDADPIWLQIVQTIKAASGFTVVFNAPTDSANYLLEWAVAQDATEEYP